MSVFYFDSSALAKRYLTEIGSDWVLSIIESDEHTIILAEMTKVEVAAALAARHRASKGITREERDKTVALLTKHCLTEYQLITVNQMIVEKAVTLTQKHRLRGYDAIQLATALTANTATKIAGIRDFTFVAADNDLVVAAQAEGLACENPNHHP